MATTSTTSTTAAERNAVLRRMGAAAAIAVVANLAIWALGDGVLDPIVVPAGDDATELEWYAVVVASLVGVVLAALASLAVRRLARKPRAMFLTAVAVGTLLSLGGPVSGDIDTDNKLALAAMHLTTGAVAAGVLAPTLTRQRMP